ncbi:hypothetical protein GCM10023116_31120 [Kistimonas scapharcae]|uniref:Uncharacterized protein n=1 Tax=Kistimonas scapharcae TaxID=1036133 RepID=A0ABP8V4A8_9GAMM
MKQALRKLICFVFGCAYRGGHGESLCVKQKTYGARRWHHCRFEHRVRCSRCRQWGRWIRHKNFEAWLKRQK